VLLALRAQPTEKDAHSPAETTFHVPLTLPSQFLTTSSPPSDDFLSSYQSVFKPFPPLPTTHNLPKSHLQHHPPSSLFTAPQVLVRRDAHCPPLSPLYDGPYTVITRSPSHFTIQLPTSTDTVSITRLKPFHSALSSPPIQVPRPRGRPRHVTFAVPPVSTSPPHTTRSGRPSRPPARLSL
jgi:hypothetical protein